MTLINPEAEPSEHLLPAVSTEFEKALSAPTARISAVPVPLRLLWRPMECPASHLPWLAWALSVDTWDPAWPEAVQRQVVAQAVALHRIKGTRRALESALEPISEGLSIEEWFEYGGQPYRFRVTQRIGATEPWSGNKLGLIYQTIIRAKNVRSWLETIRVRRPPTPAPVRVGAIVATRLRIRNIIDAATNIILPRAPVFAGAVVVTHARVRIGG